MAPNPNPNLNLNPNPDPNPDLNPDPNPDLLTLIGGLYDGASLSTLAQLTSIQAKQVQITPHDAKKREAFQWSPREPNSDPNPKT